MTIIGENFEDIGGQCVCGAVVSSRKKDNKKLALWLSEREESTVMPIGRAFYRLLQENGGFTGEIAFEDFGDNSKAIFSLNGK